MSAIEKVGKDSEKKTDNSFDNVMAAIEKDKQESMAARKQDKQEVIAGRREDKHQVMAAIEKIGDTMKDGVKEMKTWMDKQNKKIDRKLDNYGNTVTRWRAFKRISRSIWVDSRSRRIEWFGNNTRWLQARSTQLSPTPEVLRRGAIEESPNWEHWEGAGKIFCGLRADLPMKKRAQAAHGAACALFPAFH